MKTGRTTSRIPLLTGILIALMGISAQAGDAGEWLTDFEKAKAIAKEKNLPILADFTGSDWCGWCIKLDEEVFSKAEFQEYAKDHFVLFIADFPQDKPQSDEVIKQNETLSKTYAIEGYPTILILDADGKELARTGYQEGGAAAYVDHLKQLTK